MPREIAAGHFQLFDCKESHAVIDVKGTENIKNDDS